VKTLYETIPAKGEIKIKDFAMGTIHSQAQSSRCEVVDAK
jgi:hypothetical protein